MTIPAPLGIIEIGSQFDASISLGAFPLKFGKRLCLMCFASWAETPDPYCPACQLELEFRRGTELSDRPVRNNTPSDWTGPSTLQNAHEGSQIDQEDLQFGFYESNLSGALDAELTRDKRER